MFTHAIVRPPAPSFAEGLTTANLGRPQYELALNQHQAYCRALERCGLRLTKLDAEPNFPDSCFVEDVAVLIRALPNDRAAPTAILTRPGAPSRTGEVESMRKPLAKFFANILEIESPGTVDGGDICQAGNHFFIGLSARTNEAGARQLAEFLDRHEYSSSFVDLRELESEPGAVFSSPSGRGWVRVRSIATGPLLHLKSGISHLGDNRLAITAALSGQPEFSVYELVSVSEDEQYAANCVRINDYVLIAAGFAKLQRELTNLGYQTIALDMSEFQKMDGGLSCLSLRF